MHQHYLVYVARYFVNHYFRRLNTIDISIPDSGISCCISIWAASWLPARAMHPLGNKFYAAIIPVLCAQPLVLPHLLVGSAVCLRHHWQFGTLVAASC